MRTHAGKSKLRLALGGLWLLVSLVSAVSVQAQNQPPDVPPEHWAYEAVRELADKGLVTGYPDGRFLGNRTLTRYEMATIIQRLLRNIEQMQPATPPVTPQAPTPDAPPAPPGVTPEQLTEVRRLVDEFRVELTVIGTDLKAVKDRLDALEQRQGSLEKQITDPKGPIQSTINAVEKLRRITFSGYVQGRYESFEDSEEGTSRVDRFTLRRVRITAAARPTQKVGVRIQPDFVSSAGNPPTSTSAATTVQLKDAWVDYYFAGDPARGLTATIGQFKWPFGYEIPLSSSVRWTPERSTWANVLFPGERDRGVKVATATGPAWTAEVGVFNGTGINTNDNNNEKDIVGRVRGSLGKALDVGVSGYFGKALVFTPAADGNPATTQEFTRNRYGADFQLQLGGWRLIGEYVQAKERGREPWGWDAYLIRDLGARTQLVAKYDEFDDDNDDPTRQGKLNSWNLGLIRYLDPSTRLKLFYQINREDRNSRDNNVATVEVIALF